MHGPTPTDVTLDPPHWWQPGMPLLPPADHMAPVPLKRKRGASAEPKTDPAKRTNMRIPDEAKLWFVDFHAYQARVHRESLAYNIRLAKHLVRSSSGPWHPTHSAGGMTAAHVTSAADHPWTCQHSPFRVTSHMPSRVGSVSASLPVGSTSTTVCCARSTSNSSLADDGRGSSYAACSSHGNSRRLAPATSRARLTLPESANFCSCASSTCAIASKSHRIASGTWTRQLCARFQQASVGGPRGPKQPMSSPRAPSSRSRSLRT